MVRRRVIPSGCVYFEDTTASMSSCSSRCSDDRRRLVSPRFSSRCNESLGYGVETGWHALCRDHQLACLEIARTKLRASPVSIATSNNYVCPEQPEQAFGTKDAPDEQTMKALTRNRPATNASPDALIETTISREHFFATFRL